MSRAVRRINTALDKPEDGAPRPFSAFAEIIDIVLLGDPGAGKSHLFREAAVAQAGRFIRARDFLNTPANRLQGPPLFIDGLDEKRGGRGDRDTVDALVTKLFDVNPPKVRISCRAPDWLGESDLAALRPFFEQRGEICVLHLESLSHTEQIAVLGGQGVDEDAAKAFLREATDRGLTDFLENPQNLIMLWRAVQTGSWPATRKQLFELSTKLMLQEFDRDRSRSGSGSYSVDELRPVAGAICATRLISDVAAITLTDQEGTSDIPGYRSIRFFPPEKVQAALGRRVFDAGPELETVDYAHRTTAEFLAAEFLATQVRNGLPFGRVVALIGVDNHPAAELRGLHAWLAVHLGENAEQLIDADPYGVLSYGDAASLSPTSCTSLVRALDRLSQSNPWFRSEDGRSRTIGALARPDMVGEFRAILNNPTSEFGVRSVVIDALAMGTPLPEMLPDLAAILIRQAAPYAERVRALDAVMRLGDPGKAAIRDAFQGLNNTLNDLRLRAEIIENLYNGPYGPADIVTLVHDILHASEAIVTGMLFKLGNDLPVSDLPAILDGITAPPSDATGFDRRNWEVGSFYSRILLRAWRELDAIDSARAITWLNKRIAFKGGHAESRAGDLREALRENPDRLRTLAAHFFSTVPIDERRWLALNLFREAILFQLGAIETTQIIVEQLKTAEPARSAFLYQVALALAIGADPPVGNQIFDGLYSLAKHDASLIAARDAAVVTNLPENYFSIRHTRAPETRDGPQKQQKDFDQNIQAIRSGEHLGWAKHVAKIYFALYSDVDQALSPPERIAAWLGGQRTDAALEAFTGVLSRKDLPSFADVMALAAKRQHYDWWYAIVAGLDQRFSAGQGLSGLSDDLLKAMLAFDITCPIPISVSGQNSWLVHPWRKALTNERPELVRDTYVAVVALRLSQNDQICEGLTELLAEPALESYRSGIVLDLLRHFPNASIFRLEELFDSVAKLPATHQDVLKLAMPIISGSVAADEPQRDLWLVTAYLISPVNFESGLRQRAAARPQIVFTLRDRSGFGRSRDESTEPLPLSMLELIAQLTGSLFPDTPFPTEVWSGDTNAWDACEYFRALTNLISTFPSQAATDALTRLAADPSLTSHRRHVLYALANQKQRRRDAEYDRPDWPKTIAALDNGPPATVADLHALLVAQLSDLSHQIARANTDIYKQFWNVDEYSRLKEPRPEETCRDFLITLLKPRLLPLEITIEPEGHMVADKRADISVAMPARKILCELKRDYHAAVWTAIMGQLERFYAHDPDAKGFGVYCIFWFGSKRPRPIPAPPNGLKPPKSAQEMEMMLRSLVPQNIGERLAIVVSDVSGEL